MPQIRKSLLQFVFNGAFMKRWNDKVRPMELMEVDKQAHKMIAAWALYEVNSRGMSLEDRLRLGQVVVEGGLFEYFFRLVITDIKPPIFYKIMENEEQARLLTNWVLEQVEPRVQSLGQGFLTRLKEYLRTDKPMGDPEDRLEKLGRRILKAAHLYASRWEFGLIKEMNRADPEFKEIEAWFEDGLEGHRDLAGVRELTDQGGALYRFAHLCGQLRFQKRWSQTPRVPETSVIGHMFLVACYGYFFSICLDACPARRLNDFFAGLFHDLPELLTRDIISPVKKSVPELKELISAHEREELSRRVLKPLSEADFGNLSDRLSYFLGLAVNDEFKDTVLTEKGVEVVTPAELAGEMNRDELDPKDGEMLKVCDDLAAFVEAYTAIRNGISSDQLQQALWRFRAAYQQRVLGQDLHIGALIADFD